MENEDEIRIVKVNGAPCLIVGTEKDVCLVATLTDQERDILRSLLVAVVDRVEAAQREHSR